MNDEEELEALDSFSVSSAGSAVSCCLPGVSYAAAVRSSVDQRVRRRSPNKYTLHCNTSEVSGEVYFEIIRLLSSVGHRVTRT